MSTLDQKRKDRPKQDNDLYDAVEKFRHWHEVLQGSDAPGLREKAVNTAYHQPDYWDERWRVLDDDFLRVFPEEESQAGHALGIHEVFQTMARDPGKATAQVCKEGAALIAKVHDHLVKASLAAAWPKKNHREKKREAAKEELDKRLRQLRNDLIKLNRDKGLLDREFDQFALIALRDTLDATAPDARAKLAKAFQKIAANPKMPDPEAVPEEQLLAILKCFARLDGYNLVLRSVEAKQRERKDTASTKDAQQLAWVTPVRAWARLDTWGTDPDTEEEIARPTHDVEGNVDPEYLKFLAEKLNVFDDGGTVRKEEKFQALLDPDCIEAADLNLSAGRHKPFIFEASEHTEPATLIRQLDKVHEDIRDKLKNLLDMVEAKV